MLSMRTFGLNIKIQIPAGTRMGQVQSVMLTYKEELDDIPSLFVKMPTKGLKGDFHEYRQVVGCGQVFLVVGESFEEGIVEDVVND